MDTLFSRDRWRAIHYLSPTKIPDLACRGDFRKRPLRSNRTRSTYREGLWTDRPEVNFYTATFDSNDGNADPIRLAARTASVPRPAD